MKPNNSEKSNPTAKTHRAEWTILALLVIGMTAAVSFLAQPNLKTNLIEQEPPNPVVPPVVQVLPDKYTYYYKPGVPFTMNFKTEGITDALRLTGIDLSLDYTNFPEQSMQNAQVQLSGLGNEAGLTHNLAAKPARILAYGFNLNTDLNPIVKMTMTLPAPLQERPMMFISGKKSDGQFVSTRLNGESTVMGILFVEDTEAPVISFNSNTNSSILPATLPVHLKVQDNGLIGQASWRLQKLENGQFLDTQTTGSFSVDTSVSETTVTLNQTGTWRFKVYAVDQAANATTAYSNEYVVIGGNGNANSSNSNANLNTNGNANNNRNSAVPEVWANMMATCDVDVFWTNLTEGAVYNVIRLAIQPYPLISNPNGYPDLPTDYWAYPYINDLATKGIIDHNLTNSFQPERNVSRAELAKYVVKSAIFSGVISGIDTAGAPVFEDVPTNSWYYPYVATATKANLMTGKKDGNGNPTNMFGPNDLVARFEVIQGAVNAGGIPMNVTPPAPYIDLLPDVAYRNYVSAAYNSDVIGAYSAYLNSPILSSLRPVDPAYHTEVVVLFSRALGNRNAEVEIPFLDGIVTESPLQANVEGPHYIDPAANLSLNKAYAYMVKAYLNNVTSEPGVSNKLIYSCGNTNPLQVNATSSPSHANVNGSVQFNAEVNGGTFPYTYHWEVKKYSTQVLTTSEEQNFTYAFSERGWYTAAVTVRDSTNATGFATTNTKVGNPPLAPTHLTALNDYPKGIILSWDDVEPNYYYKLYKRNCGTDENCTNVAWADLTSTEENYFIDTAVSSGNWYEYYVRSFVNGWEGETSNLAKIQYSTDVVPFAAEMTVTPSEGIEPLNVQFNVNASGATLPYSYSWKLLTYTGEVSLNNNSSYWSSGFSRGVYTAQVYIKAADHRSTEASGRVVVSENMNSSSNPYVPQNVTATSYGLSNQVFVRWDPVEPPSATYNVYRSECETVDGVNTCNKKLAIIGSTSGAVAYLDPTAAPQTTYIYYVSSVVPTLGESSNGASNQVTTGLNGIGTIVNKFVILPYSTTGSVALSTSGIIGTVAWESSDPSLVTVSEDGQVSVATTASENGGIAFIKAYGSDTKVVSNYASIAVIVWPRGDTEGNFVVDARDQNNVVNGMLMQGTF